MSGSNRALVVIVLTLQVLAAWPALSQIGISQESERTAKHQTALLALGLDGLIGSDIVSAAGEALGTVEDVLFNPDGTVKSLVVSFGGFLGFGANAVELRPNEVEAVIAADGMVELRVQLTPENIADRPMYEPSVEEIFSEQFSRAFAEAALAFLAPDRMTYGEAKPFELSLAPITSGIDPAALLADPSGAVVVEGIKYTLKMQATLYGPDFTVTPTASQSRTVLPDEAAKWEWLVVPTAYGEGQLLFLSVFAILDGPDRELPPHYIRSFTARITVNVGFFDRLVMLSSKLQPVHALVAGLIGCAVAVATVALARRKSEQRAGSAQGSDTSRRRRL